MQRACFLLLTTALPLIALKLPAVAQPPTAALESPYELCQQLQPWQQRLQDWAQLAVYRAANAALAPLTVSEQRVVFFGDSITNFWNLAAAFPGQPYINRGLSGQTTPQLLLRFRADVVALKPRVVVILGGTNDLAGNTGPMTLDQIEDNYASMAALAQAHQI
jgi:hypothetical protein